MLDLLTGTIQIIQPSAGAWVDGEFVNGATTTLNIPASVQPLKASDLKMLPEGRRNTEAIKIYAETKAVISDEKNSKNNSKIVYDGKNYEVFSVFNWSIGTDLKHYKIIALKIDGEGNGTS